MKTGLSWKRFYIGFLAAVVLTSCAEAATSTPTILPSVTPVPPTSTPEPSPTPEAYSVTPIKGVLYATVNDTKTYLNVYVPSAATPMPVVIVVHGSGQTAADFSRLSNAISKRGALVYNINIFDQFPHLWKIKRIACAVRFARATAADYGGDPARITLIGNSSGAATGLVVALAGEDFEGDCVENDESPQVDAFIGYEGPYDYATTVYNPSFNHAKLKVEDPELWNAINPYSHIGRNPELQIRLIHGKDTDVNWYDVRPKVSTELYNTLQDAGYDVELNLIEGAHHIDLTLTKSEGFEFAVQLVTDLIRSTP